jgi:hypothetical protein
MVPHGGWHNDTICTVEIKTRDVHNEDTAIQKKEEPAVMLFDTDEQLINYLRSLPEDYWDFRDVDTHKYTHGLHSYPAVMVSPISANIIKIVKQYKEVNSLFDPFSGSGTVLVEGILANIPKVAGNDINPLALLLTKVKTTHIDFSHLQFEYG